MSQHIQNIFFGMLVTVTGKNGKVLADSQIVQDLSGFFPGKANPHISPWSFGICHVYSLVVRFNEKALSLFQMVAVVAYKKLSFALYNIVD